MPKHNKKPSNSAAEEQVVHTPTELPENADPSFIVMHMLIQHEDNHPAFDNNEKVAWCGKRWVPHYIAEGNSPNYYYCAECVDAHYKVLVRPVVRDYYGWLDNVAERYAHAMALNEQYDEAINKIMNPNAPEHTVDAVIEQIMVRDDGEPYGQAGVYDEPNAREALTEEQVREDAEPLTRDDGSEFTPGMYLKPDTHKLDITNNTTYCPRSKRTEGTVNMQGEVCSFCGSHVSQ